MSQKVLILEHLKTGRGITPQVALDRWGCFRLAARIRELKDEGFLIDTHIVQRGNKRWASYLMDRA
jgi:Helix-turn-helix domain